MAAIVLLCGGFLAFKLVRDNTTLSFSFLLDGKPLSVGMTPTVKVDGLPFTSGCTIAPGSHELTAELPNAESFALRVRVLYGNKNLGDLTLESSKGSLLVSVNPSPASVIVRRGIETIGNGDAPLTLEKLPFGDYDLEIKHGEYKEAHSVKIQGKQRTEAKIDLNLGGVDLSSAPADAEFEISGNDRHWQGKLPTHVDDVPAGAYTLLLRRGDYTEQHPLNITRQQRLATNVVMNLGSVDLSSDPSDAEFELSGNGLHWQGKLPTKIDYVPCKTYSLVVTRKGWELGTNIVVSRGLTATNKTEFSYGSIEVTSEPTGLVIATNGVEIGKTPTTLRELRPGQYKLAATDGENDLLADINVGQREPAKFAFVFHYGTAQLASTPAGASVFRKGKEVGKTPLKLEHIPAGETAVTLKLDGYVTTNFALHVVEGESANLTAKLVSERHVQGMQQAAQAFAAGQFSESQKFLTAILEREPNDPEAMEWQDKVSQAVAKAEEASRVKQADAIARTLVSLTWLDFQKVFTDCTDTKQVQNPVQVNDGYYDKSGKFHVTGQHTEMQTETVHIFNPIKFSNKYQGKTFGFNCPDKWSVSKIDKEGGILLKQTRGLLGSDNISVTAPASDSDALRSLQKGQKVTIKGVLTKCEPGVFVQTLYLEDAEMLDNLQQQKTDATPKLSTSNPVVSSEATTGNEHVSIPPTLLNPTLTDGRWGFVNQSGTTVINPQFERAQSFSEGLAGVRTGGKWGFIGENGKFSINPQFDAVENFAEGLAPVRIGGRWGFINPAGKFVINPQFNEAMCFTNGLARVKLGGQFGYINTSGMFVNNPAN